METNRKQVKEGKKVPINNQIRPVRKASAETTWMPLISRSTPAFFTTWYAWGIASLSMK